MSRRRAAATALALAAMLLPALTPGAVMVVCFAADGSVSLERAHASGSCAHDGSGEDEHAHEHAHEHGGDELLDHDHGCTDRPLDGRFLTAGASATTVTPMLAAPAPSVLQTMHSTVAAARQDGAHTPLQRPYHQRTVVMLI